MAWSSRLLNAAAKGPLATRWSRVHAELYRRTGGRFIPRWFGGAVMVIETVGRKSGELRRTPIIRVEHGDGYVAIPSNAGAGKTPAWWLNCKAAGEATVVDGRRRRRVRPRVAQGAERQELWEKFAAVYPGLDDYKEYTDREWPVVMLEPVD